MSNKTIKTALWWLCLVVAPVLLVIIELFHPAGFTDNPGMYEYLSKPEVHTHAHHALFYFGPEWWFALHMIQTPLVGLVVVGLWLLMDGIDRVNGALAFLCAWLSRMASFVLIVYYTALDSIGGIGLGKTIEIVESLAKAPVDQPHLTADQLAGVVLVLNRTWTDPWVGGVGSFISHTGSWAAFFAALFAGIALWMAKRAPLPAVLILVAFGWMLQLSHASFHGPIAFALLAISSLWIRWAAKGAAQA